MAKLTYSDVLARYDRARAFGETKSLPEYAQHLNDTFGTDAFSEGLRDGPWTRFSTRVDQAIQDSPIGEVATETAGGIGSLFGEEESGRKVGAGLPRALLQSAPLYLLGPEAGAPATIAALGGTGALFGGQTYADTGSVKQALVSGVTAAAMPALGKVGGSIGARMFGGTKLSGLVGGKMFNEVLPETAADAAKVNLGRFAGSQAVQAASMLTSTMVQDRMGGGNMSFADAATSPEFWLGQIPFTVYDAVHMSGTKTPTAAQIRPHLTQDLPVVPKPRVVVQQPQNDKTAAQVQVLLSNLENLKGATLEERSLGLKNLFDAVNQPEGVVVKKGMTGETSDTDAEAAVNLTGRADAVGNGNWRFLVNNHDSGDRIGDVTGHTLFVNGAEPTFDPESGLMKFQVKPSQLKAAKYQLTPEDFGKIQPKSVEGELPVQPPPESPSREDIELQANALRGQADAIQALRMKKYPLALRTSDIQGLHDMGLSAPETAAVIANPDPTHVASVKAVVARNEQAQMETGQAKEKTLAAPTTSGEIPKLFVDPVAATQKLEAAVENGATPTQAVQEGVLQDQTPLVDKGTTTQRVQKKRASDLAKAKYAQQVAAGQALIKAYTDHAAMNPDLDHPFVQAGKAILKSLQSQGTIDPKFTDRVASVVSKWAAGEYKDTSIERLQGLLKQTEATARLKSQSPVSYLVDGKRVYGTRAEVEKYVAENDLAKDGWGAEATDKKRGAKGKTHYVGKRKVEAASLDQQIGEGTTTLGDVLDMDVNDIPNIQRPVVSRNDTLTVAQHLYENPTDLAEDVRTPNSAPGDEHVADVKEQLGQFIEAMKLKEADEYGINTQGFLDELNNQLKAKGLGVVDDHAMLKEVMGNVAYWMDNFRDTYRDHTLGSTVPGDEELGRQMGLHGTVQDVAKYLASQKESLGPVADLLEAIHNSGILPKDTFIIRPGEDGHVPESWFIQHGIEGLGDGFNVPPILNVPYWPAKENLARYHISLAHEVVHLSEEALSQRSDPAAMQYRKDRTAVLNTLRDSSAIPAKVRAAIKTTIREGLLEKARTATTPEELHQIRDRMYSLLGPHKDHFTFLYAMQDELEMVASLFSDPRIMEIAGRTKMPEKTGFVGNVLNFLSRAFNRLIGGPVASDSALAHLLSSYDNYLTGGILRKTYNGSNYIRDSLISIGVRPDQMASRMQGIDRTYARGTLESSLTAFQREQANGLTPTMGAKGVVHPDVESAIRTGKTGDVYDSTMNLLADQLPVHQDLMRRMQQDLQVTQGLLKEVKEGRVPGTVPPKTEENLKLANAQVNAMSRALDKQALALARFNKLNQLQPEGWAASIAEGLNAPRIRNVEPPDEVPDSNEVRKLVALDRLSGKSQIPWLQKWFMLTPHLKELHPEIKPVISGVQTEQGLAHHRMVMLNGAYAFDPITQRASEKVVKSNQRVSQNPKLSEAASNLLRWQNKQNKGQMLDRKDPFVQKTLKEFNPNDRDAILQVMDSISARHKEWVNELLPETMNNVNVDTTGSLIVGMEKMLPDQARKVSQELYNGLAALVNPETSAYGAELLRKTASDLSPKTYMAALQHAQQLAKKTADWITTVASKPGWTTEQRYGTDKLVMVNATGDRMTTAGNPQELQQRQRSYQAKGYEVLDYIKADDVKSPRLGMTKEFLQSLEQIDPDAAALMRANAAAQTPLPSVQRRFASGREYINMVDNANQFYQKMNNWLKNRSVRARTSLDMLHPEIAGNAELKNFLDQHVSNFQTPDNPLARKIVESTYFYKLGFDLGNAALEGTQNLTTGMSALIGETGSVTDAFELWGRAVKELTQHLLTKKWSNPETTQFMSNAAEFGQQGIASWSDFYDGESHAVYDVAAGPLAKTASVVKNGARSFTSMFTRFNDRIALLSAYELGRSRGMSVDEATSFSFDVKARGLFTGGKAQRSVGLWSIKSRPVPQLLGALQTYSLGWFSQLAENFQKGFGTAPVGLTETQRTGAKKAFLYSLMSQAALAGVLGLPGVGQGLALLGQATGTDPKGWLRQNLASLFDEDQTYGGAMTGLAMRGIGSAALPFDPSSRASVSIPFIGVDAYKGFSPENLGGAAVSQIGDFMTGLLGMLHGDVTAAETLLPNALKRPAALALNQGDIRDARGGLQVELSPAERFLMGIGLTPSRVQTQRDIGEAVKKANKAAQQERESMVDKAAVQLRKGDTQGAHESVLEYLQGHTDTEPGTVVSQIAARVNAQTFPYDPRTSLEPGVDLHGLVPDIAPNQVARNKSAADVKSSFGMFPSSSGLSRARSMFVDQAQTADPTLSVRAVGRLFSPNVSQLPRVSSYLLPLVNQSGNQ